MRKNTFISLAALIISTAIGLGLTYIYDFSHTPRAAEKSYTQISYPEAPDVSFTKLDGSEIDLKNLKGKTVLLNFWATWCAPCVIEFPQMLKLAYENDNIIFLAVSVDSNKEAIEKFLKKQNQKHLQSDDVILAWDQNKMISIDTFQVLKYPETIIINPAGEMSDKVVGAIDWLSDETMTRLEKSF